MKKLLMHGMVLFGVITALACNRAAPTETDGCTVSGRVVSKSGQILRGVDIKINGSGIDKNVRVDKNGNYLVSGVPKGYCTITPVGAGYTFAPEMIVEQITETGLTIADIIADEVNLISGTVVDTDGRPVPGADVLLSGGDSQRMAKTGSDGCYAFSNLPTGKYTVLVSKTPYLFNRNSVHAEIGGNSRVGIDFTAYRPPNRTVNTDTFLGMEINRLAPGLRVYHIQNAEQLAAGYRMGGMRWFTPTGVDYASLDENKIPKSRIPVAVCHTSFGLHKHYSEYKTEELKSWFLTNVNWLINNCTEDYYLPYPFLMVHAPEEPQPIGWVSGMAQGEALAVTCIAYNLTGEPKYLEAARGFFRTLYHNSDQIWCFGVDPEGYYWLEEYPTHDFCHVLNGKLFGLWGLWNYYTVTGDEFALTLFEAGIRSFLDHYPFYKMGEGSLNSTRYCFHYERPIGENYHNIHVTQVQSYADFFHIPEFWDALRLFQK